MNSNDTDKSSPPIRPVWWPGFFSQERKPPSFVIPYLLPEGRQVAVFAEKKLGKSLLTLDAAAAAATGRSVLGESPREPVSVMYLDLEMTEQDLFERLEDMGYGTEDEDALAANFHYYLLPALPPLDTPEGGAEVMELVRWHEARAVVIDTTSRVISGRENDSDTFHNLYLHTGIQLKRDGIGLLRLDHSGKDASKGQRGSSAKDTDVDVVYGLTKQSAGKFVLSHGGVTRIPWMPDDVVIERKSEPLRHVALVGTPEGTQEVMRLLTGMQLPTNTSVRACKEALKALKDTHTAREIEEAVRLRKRGVKPSEVSETEKCHGIAA